MPWNPAKTVADDGIESMISNGTRAEYAEAGIHAFLDATGERFDNVDTDAISDLVADLGHLCDREGLDFLPLVETATMNWETER